MRRYSWALRLLITATLLYVVLSSIPVQQVTQAMLRARVSYVVLGLSCSLLVNGLEAIRLRLLLVRQGMGLTVWQILKVNLAVRFYGLFLPGVVAGGVLRWYRFAQPEGRWAEVLACIVFSRVVDTAILVVLGLGFWTLAGPAGVGWMVGAALLGLLGLLLAGHLVVSHARMSPRSWASLERILHRSWMPRGAWEKLARLAKATREGYQLSHGLAGAVAGLSLMAHLGGMLSFLCLARSLGIDLSFVHIGWIRSVVIVLTMLPISIAGLGLREGSLLLLLRPYGVTSTDAVALSFLLFTTALVIRVLGGFAELHHVLRSPATRVSRQGQDPS